MNTPEPTLPCTFIWDSIYGSIEHGNPEGLEGIPLLPRSTDLAIARYLPNARRTEIKWIIDQISIPIQSGDQFWFYFESRSSTLLLGELSTIHTFFGPYALVEISPILHLDWNHGWMAEEGSLFWMDVDDLVLDDQQQRHAQRAFLRHPTFSLFSNHNSDEE
jgi:hypothetical protein